MSKHGEFRAAASVCLIVGAIVGCSVGPRYTRPYAAMPRRWIGAPDTASSLADIAWWWLFEDTVLHDLIVDQNKNVQITIARVNETRAAFVAQRGARGQRSFA